MLAITLIAALRYVGVSLLAGIICLFLKRQLKIAGKSFEDAFFPKRSNERSFEC